MINPNTFDLNLLRVFDILMRERSVSAAADRLGLSQPAVSNALNRMRDHFGDPLFVRTRQGMEPTALALRLKDSIEQGLGIIRAGLSQGVIFEPQTSDRSFTLLMNDMGELSFLPPLLQKLAVEAPGMKLTVLELSRDGYEAALDGGAADLAIGRVTLSDSFRSQLIHTSSFVALLRTDHPLLDHSDGAPRITYEAYRSAKHIAVNPRGASGNPVDRALAKDGVTRPIMLTIPHASVLPSLLAHTDLIATVPDKCIDALIRTDRLAWVPLPFEVECNYVYQWWHKRQDDDPGHRWLRDVLSTLL